MKNRNFKYLFLAACCGAAAMSGLPVLSGACKSGTIFVRGFNLMEFSPCGCIPLIAPFALFVILYGSQSKQAREIEMLMLAIGNLMCFVQSCNYARDWMLAQEGMRLVHHPAMVFYPSAFFALVLLYIAHDTFVKVYCRQLWRAGGLYLSFFVPGTAAFYEDDGGEES